MTYQKSLMVLVFVVFSCVFSELKASDTIYTVIDQTTDINHNDKPMVYLKSNLLYDLATCVNLSMEVPVTKSITIEGTVVCPWWHSMKRHHTLEILYVALTPRYYWGKGDSPFESFFSGLTVGSAKYDLQLTRHGVQGSMWHLSPVIGYTHHIAKRWKMEYSASVGFVQTKYRKYTQKSDTPYGEIKVKDYPWVQKVLNTVFPTSLNVSLVYMIPKYKHRHHEQ